eukprot:4988877-Prymnesium_polylepis.1
MAGRQDPDFGAVATQHPGATCRKLQPGQRGTLASHGLERRPRCILQFLALLGPLRRVGPRGVRRTLYPAPSHTLTHSRTSTG